MARRLEISGAGRALGALGAFAKSASLLFVAVSRKSLYNTAISADLEKVILRCLQKNREERFASVRDLLFALKKCCGLALVKSRSPGQVRRNLALGILILAFLGVAFLCLKAEKMKAVESVVSNKIHAGPAPRNAAGLEGDSNVPETEAWIARAVHDREVDPVLLADKYVQCVPSRMALTILNYLAKQSPERLYASSFENSDVDYKFQNIAALQAVGDFARARRIATVYRDQAIAKKLRKCLVEAENHVIQCLRLEKNAGAIKRDVAAFLSKVKENYPADFFENVQQQINGELYSHKIAEPAGIDKAGGTRALPAAGKA